MADELNEGFLSSYFKNLELLSNAKRFDAEMAFRQSESAQQAEQFSVEQSRLRDQESSRMGLASAQFGAEEAARKYTQEMQDLQAKLGLLDQVAAGKLAAPQPTAAVPGVIGFNPAMVNAIETPIGQLAPVPLAQQLATQSRAKLDAKKLEDEYELDSLHNIYQGLVRRGAIDADPRLEGRLAMTKLVGPAAIGAFKQGEFTAEEALSSILMPAMQAFQRDIGPGGNPNLIHDPEWRKNMEDVVGWYSKLRARAGGSNNAGVNKEIDKNSRAESMQELTKMMVDSKLDPKSPTFYQKYQEALQALQFKLAGQGKRLDPDALEEFQRAIPQLSGRLDLMSLILGGNLGKKE